MQDSTFIGLDVHKATVSVAVAQGERGSEIRHWGTVTPMPYPEAYAHPDLAGHRDANLSGLVKLRRRVPSPPRCDHGAQATPG